MHGRQILVAETSSILPTLPSVEDERVDGAFPIG